MSGLNNRGNNREWSGEIGLEERRRPEVADELDTVFDVLRDRRRRFLLYYLNDVDASVISFEEAVEAVRAYLGADSDSDVEHSRQQIRIDLIHAQFPRLEDAGVLEYDPRRAELDIREGSPLNEWIEQTRRLELE